MIKSTLIFFLVVYLIIAGGVVRPKHMDVLGCIVDRNYGRVGIAAVPGQPLCSRPGVPAIGAGFIENFSVSGMIPIPDNIGLQGIKCDY